jgi:hypothetical protein
MPGDVAPSAPEQLTLVEHSPAWGDGDTMREVVGSVGQCGVWAGRSGPKRELGASSDLVDIFLLSLVAMFNPTLLAAVTIMMLMPHPKRLMLGYLLGAYTTSIACWCVIVFALGGSSSETSSAKHTISPAIDSRQAQGRQADRVATAADAGQGRPKGDVPRRSSAELPRSVIPRRDGSHP